MNDAAELFLVSSQCCTKLRVIITLQITIITVIIKQHRRYTVSRTQKAGGCYYSIFLIMKK